MFTMAPLWARMAFAAPVTAMLPPQTSSSPSTTRTAVLSAELRFPLSMRSVPLVSWMSSFMQFVLLVSVTPDIMFSVRLPPEMSCRGEESA